MSSPIDDQPQATRVCTKQNAPVLPQSIEVGQGRFLRLGIGHVLGRICVVHLREVLQSDCNIPIVWRLLAIMNTFDKRQNGLDQHNFLFIGHAHLVTISLVSQFEIAYGIRSGYLLSMHF